MAQPKAESQLATKTFPWQWGSTRGPPSCWASQASALPTTQSKTPRQAGAALMQSVEASANVEVGMKRPGTGSKGLGGRCAVDQTHLLTV
jgi:hypothetical protein